MVDGLFVSSNYDDCSTRQVPSAEDSAVEITVLIEGHKAVD